MIVWYAKVRGAKEAGFAGLTVYSGRNVWGHCARAKSTLERCKIIKTHQKIKSYFFVWIPDFRENWKKVDKVEKSWQQKVDTRKMSEPASTNISSGIGFEIDPCDLRSCDMYLVLASLNLLDQLILHELSVSRIQ